MPITSARTIIPDFNDETDASDIFEIFTGETDYSVLTPHLPDFVPLTPDAISSFMENGNAQPVVFSSNDFHKPELPHLLASALDFYVKEPKEVSLHAYKRHGKATSLIAMDMARRLRSANSLLDSNRAFSFALMPPVVERGRLPETNLLNNLIIDVHSSTDIQHLPLTYIESQRLFRQRQFAMGEVNTWKLHELMLVMAYAHLQPRGILTEDTQSRHLKPHQKDFLMEKVKKDYKELGISVANLTKAYKELMNTLITDPTFEDRKAFDGGRYASALRILTRYGIIGAPTDRDMMLYPVKNYKRNTIIFENVWHSHVLKKSGTTVADFSLLIKSLKTHERELFSPHILTIYQKEELVANSSFKLSDKTL